jgi:hypothetical protein
MSLTNKLVNPTPFNVKLPYEKGVELKIPSDGQLELTIEQMDDYRPGKPGSEEVRKMLSYHGLFLMDVDRSYDSQALQALETSLKEKKKVIDDFVAALKTARTKQGYSLEPTALQEVIDSAGYGEAGLTGHVTSLQKRVSMLRKVVQTDTAKGKVKETLDPTRTCLVTKPPREFPSKIALAMFLEEHPDIKKEHEALSKASQ